MTVRISVPGRCAADPGGTPERALQRFHIGVHESVEVIGAHRGGRASVELLAGEADVFEVEYENGFVDFLSVGQARERAGIRRSSADGSFEFPATLGPRTKRGLVDWAIKKIRRFSPPSPEQLIKERLLDVAVDAAADVLAVAVAKWIEREFWSSAQPAGLYQVTGELALERKFHQPEEVARLAKARREPYLVLIHGTFSNSAAAFSGLAGTPEWRSLRDEYGERILALEHKTLSESPVENALQLIRLLPEGARVHLVSHSRGGLVGDLLSLSELSPGARAVFRKRRTIDPEPELGAIEELANGIARKRLAVERFVRIAAPAAGTLLASERLDDLLKIVFNLMKLAPPLALSPAFHFVEALTIALAGKRADPRSMPGLEAMMPDSPYVHLLNASPRRVNDGLAVMAGDVQGSGLLGRIKVFATDLFFREDHDLVVNTQSMYLGLEREGAVASFQKGADVDHFSYFRSPITRARIVNALGEWTQAAPPRGFQALPRQAGGVKVDNRTRSGSDPRPHLVFVPAQLASELKLPASDLKGPSETIVWPHPAGLAELGLARLNDDELVHGELDGALYSDLVERLSAAFRVEPCPYDWRARHAHSGKRLKKLLDRLLAESDAPVHVVAHSGGGLAALWLIQHASDTWGAVRARGGRMVLLGAPEDGSFTVAAWMHGHGTLPRMLALIDPSFDARSAGGALAQMPGLLELLPAASLEASAWEGSGSQAPEALSAARKFRAELAEALAKDGVHRVAGKPADTLVGFDAKTGRSVVGRAGDGFALRTSAPTAAGFGHAGSWHASASHAELAEPALAPAIRELLLTGATRRLETRAEATSTSTAPAPPPTPVLFPTRGELVRSGIGADSARLIQDERWTLRVEVLHASLEKADHPVFVGHYQGTPLGGAEAFIDRRLNGLCSTRQVLGHYPGELGESEVILVESGLSGVVVVGMGTIGELTGTRLEKTIAEAALALAFKVLTQPDWIEVDGRRSAAFSAVLIGSSGRYGMTVRESVTAIVRGAVEANRTLRAAGLGERVRVDALQIVERYADTAEDAARAVRELERRLAGQLGEGLRLEPASLLRQSEGRLPGRPGHEYQEGAWERLVIESVEEPHGRGHSIEFTSLGRRARAESWREGVEAALVDAMIQETIGEADVGQTNNSLFELLVPDDFKDELVDGGNRILVVDEYTANHPWELLAARRRDGAPRPLLDRTGLLRQFKSTPSRARVQSAHGRRALVIGDPYGGAEFPELPAARKEALEVTEVLRSHDFDVVPRIADAAGAPSWLDIVNAMFEHDYRIVHIAAHGLYDPYDSSASGVVIGERRFLTAKIVSNLSRVPELVFLNCCHLGRTAAGIGADPRAAATRWNRLAASLSAEFMAMGVRVVVAAGWAVDDEAARAFARTLYEELLGRGEVYGEAVRRARIAASQEGGGRSNTWGAYQCYGDPGFRLAAGEGRSSPVQAPVSRGELLRRLEEFAQRAGDMEGELEERSRQLKQLEAQTPRDWHCGEIAFGFGRAYGELGDFCAAVERYRKALEFGDGQVPLSMLEQLVNMEVRCAVELERELPAEASRASVEEYFEAAGRRLELLRQLQPPKNSALAELRGSFHKKRASTYSDLERKRADIVAARDAYKQAHKAALSKGEAKPYFVVNWLTMSSICGGAKAKDLDLLEEIVASLALERAHESPRGQRSESFWERVALPDARVALALTRGTLPVEWREILELYRPAFRSRSTWRERGSVLEHLQDLSLLVEDPDVVRAIEGLAAELRRERPDS